MANKKRLPKPPGGELVCDNTQLALVRIKNGEIFAECHSPPKSLSKTDNFLSDYQWKHEINKWALSKILKKNSLRFQSLSKSEEHLLSKRRHSFRDPRSGFEVVVEFRLPKERET